MSSGEFIEICKEEVRKHNEQHMDKKEDFVVLLYGNVRHYKTIRLF